MPRGAGQNSHIPDINWSADKSAAVWSLLVEVEKEENYRILFGKKTVKENTGKETKAAVYSRIASNIFPELFAVNPNTVRDRVKSKLENLTTMYKKHAKRLLQTGDGVGGDEEETLAFCISGEGPCIETPPDKINIWNEIEEAFPFFPTLHHIFASRPNVTPIFITTALGPQGPKTVWYQPPKNMDSTQSSSPAQSSPSLPSRSFGSDVASNVLNTKIQIPIKNPGHHCQPKASLASRKAIENARQSVSKLPQKRSLADTLMEIQRENLAAQRAQNQDRINLELRKKILDEVKMGLWTITEAQEKIRALEKTTILPTLEPPAKIARHYSPDWEEFSDRSSSQGDLSTDVITLTSSD